MEEIISNLNYELGSMIGLTFFEPMQFMSMIIRFILNFVVVTIIARCFYYPRSQRRDYMFIFLIMSMSIFMLVNLMGSGDTLNTGAALGLFAIFGIIRYRTEAIPIREMTYLFMLVAVSVVNAMGKAEYHARSDYWEGVGILTILFANIAFIFLAWLFESSKLVHTGCSKFILYDNINLVAPEKREELKADLERRTGLKIDRVEVGMIDFLKDSCIIRIFYDEPKDLGSSIEQMAKLPKP